MKNKRQYVLNQYVDVLSFL